MENLELIEKYAAGQLEGPEKEAFEQQLQSDPSLQSDVAVQKVIIQGIKNARITELKAMLSQVPVAGAIQTGVTATKIISGAVAVGTIVTATLFYFKPWQGKSSTTLAVQNESPAIEKNIKSEERPPEPKEVQPQAATSKDNKEVRKVPDAAKRPKAIRPKIVVVDPTSELSKEPSHEHEKLEKPQSVIVTSRIGVDINSSSSKYTFHYQFNQGRLILYGIFDSGLYEILEVNGDTHSIFLYYKDNYYLLNEKQTEITPLIAIKDPELINKLKEYRGR